MREDLLQELETEYERTRAANEREEETRKERIRSGYPEIHELLKARENLVFGTLRAILDRNAKATDLSDRMEEINGQIREKLTAAGFPSDYLAPVYRCPICEDRGWVGENIRTECECFRKAYRQKLRSEIGLGNEQDETFERFDLSLFSNEPLPGRNYSQRELMAMCRKTCEEWAEHYPEASSRDLMLTGKSGLGKTFLLHAMAEKMITRGVDVLILSAYRLLEIVRKAYFSNDDNAPEIANAEVLMIDDLGSEPMIQNVTVEQLFNLLNERQSKGLSTIISTNLDMNEFRKRYTERIASRLRDKRHCRIITLEGKDIRV